MFSWLLSLEKRVVRIGSFWRGAELVLCCRSLQKSWKQDAGRKRKRTSPRPWRRQQVGAKQLEHVRVDAEGAGRRGHQKGSWSVLFLSKCDLM
jgi:hypothetical protein